MILTVKGNIPSLKNDKKIITLYKNGKKVPAITSSDKVRAWFKEHKNELFTQFAGFKITEYPITITITFWFDNDRRHDLDNAAGTLMDFMSSEGIIEDDNVHYVNCLILKYGGIDKKNPRAEIEIED